MDAGVGVEGADHLGNILVLDSSGDFNQLEVGADALAGLFEGAGIAGARFVVADAHDGQGGRCPLRSGKFGKGELQLLAQGFGQRLAVQQLCAHSDTPSVVSMAAWAAA